MGIHYLWSWVLIFNASAELHDTNTSYVRFQYLLFQICYTPYIVYANPLEVATIVSTAYYYYLSMLYSSPTRVILHWVLRYTHCREKWALDFVK